MACTYWKRYPFLYRISDELRVDFFLDKLVGWERSTYTPKEIYESFEEWTISEIIESGFLADLGYRTAVLQELI